MSNTGTVKIFNPLKGFGFVTTSEGKDIFMHIKSCNTTAEGGVPVQGDTVTFDLEESKMKAGEQQCANVTGGTGAPPKKGGGVNQGTCKSFVVDKGWGFILGADGTDIFFHAKGVTDGSTPDKGDVLNYDLEESKQKPGQMLAVNITGGTHGPLGKGKGGDKGYGKAKGGWGGDGWGGDGWGGDSWGGDGGWGGGKGWGKDGPYEGGKGKGKGGGMMGMMKGMMQSMMGGWGDDSWGGKGW